MQYAQQQCMDPIMLTENSVNNYLNQDPNNFVINLNEAGQGPAGNNNLSCANLNDLRLFHRYTVNIGNNLEMQIRYNVWYACHLNNSDISEDNIDMNNEYIKVFTTFGLFLCEVPNWYPNGPLPQNRLISLVPTDIVLNSIVSRRALDTGNLVNADRCQTGPQRIYRFV